MARLVTSGGEIQDHPTADIASPDGFTASTVPTVTATNVVRSGRASWLCAGTTTGDSCRTFPFTAPASGATLYARAYCQIDTLPASTAKVAAFLTTAAGALISVRLTSAGAFQLWNDASSTQIGADTATVIAQTGLHYRLQVRLKIGAGAVDEAELRVQEDASTGQALEETVSGTSLTISDTHAGLVRAGWVDAPGVTSNLYLDDVAVNDSTGTKQLSWPGDGAVVFTTPKFPNTVASWTDCSGGANPINGVNKLPPVGLADHVTAGHTGASAHQARCAVNTAQAFSNSTGTYQGAGASFDLKIASSFGEVDIGSATSPSMVAQRFVFGAQVTITGVKVSCGRTVSAPTDSLVAEFRADNGGVPSDVVIATASVAGSTLLSGTPTSLTTVQFSWAPQTIPAGTPMWFVMRRSDYSDTAKYYALGVDSTANPYAEGLEAELDITQTTWTTSSKAIVSTVYTTNGALLAKAAKAVICHGQGATGAKTATTLIQFGGSFVNPGFTFGDNLAIAGTYPTGWRWLNSSYLYDTVPNTTSATSTFQVTKASGSGTVACLVCATGIMAEFQPPLRTWKRVQKTADSTFWWVKQATNSLTAELAGGGLATVEPGSWLIYPEPQVVAGGDLPSTTTTITDATLSSGYIDV